VGRCTAAALAFGDAGQAFAADKPMRLSRLKVSTGLELRVLLRSEHPAADLRANFNRDAHHPAHAFKF
jgi:hypothetical protein